MIWAAAIEKSNLHRRLALAVILQTGVSLRLMLLGMMAATAVVSSWIPNVASTAIMLQIVEAFVDEFATSASDPPPSTLKKVRAMLAFSVLVAARVGGTATLIGAALPKMNNITNCHHSPDLI